MQILKDALAIGSSITLGLAGLTQVYYNSIPTERLFVVGMAIIFIAVSWDAERNGEFYPSR
jgi:hypothetical protein